MATSCSFNRIPATSAVMQPQAQVVMQPQAQAVMQPQAQAVMQPQAQVVMQPQAQVVMQPQAQVVTQSRPQQTSTSSKMSALNRIAIAQVVLGSFCVVLGAVVTGREIESVSGHYIQLTYSFGQGIWCGVWVIVAGGLGIAAGRKNTTTSRLIQSHIGFGIVGAVFSAMLFILEIFVVIRPTSRLTYSLAITITIAAFVSFILLIVSVSLAFCLHFPGCCNGCYEEGYMGSNHRVVYLASSPNQQPQFVQNLQPGQTQPGYIIQAVPVQGIAPQPAMPVVFQQRPQISSSSTTQTRAIDQLYSSDVQRKQQETLGTNHPPVASDQDHLPAYLQ
ncbi:uncharacterized protein LOC143470511 [Clavelina lepadiformis]|uniref:Uncharacterized protein n=1 Tax=Clavelina lepadiformis TaxID=159417 RepID=A0ABP0FHZ8_CLALP